MNVLITPVQYNILPLLIIDNRFIITMCHIQVYAKSTTKFFCMSKPKIYMEKNIITITHVFNIDIFLNTAIFRFDS